MRDDVMLGLMMHYDSLNEAGRQEFLANIKNTRQECFKKLERLIKLLQAINSALDTIKVAYDEQPIPDEYIKAFEEKDVR